MDGKGLCEIKVDRLRLKTVALRRLMTESRLEVESKSQECLVNHQERSHKQHLTETPYTERYARCCGRTAVSHRFLPDRG